MTGTDFVGWGQEKCEQIPNIRKCAQSAKKHGVQDHMAIINFVIL